MAMTDAQVDEMVRKLRIAFGVETTDDLVKEMVNRFLSWKLPKDFAPDAGISFKAEYNEGTPWPARHEPFGTNLFHAGQADEMVRHMLGLSNVNSAYRARYKMSYRLTKKATQTRLEAMRRGRERARLAGPSPDYPAALPDLRRRMVIENFDFGHDVHVLEFFRSDRIDCFRVVVDGKEWKCRKADELEGKK